MIKRNRFEVKYKNELTVFYPLVYLHRSLSDKQMSRYFVRVENAKDITLELTVIAKMVSKYEQFMDSSSTFL